MNAGQARLGSWETWFERRRSGMIGGLLASHHCLLNISVYLLLAIHDDALELRSVYIMHYINRHALTWRSKLKTEHLYSIFSWEFTSNEGSHSFTCHPHIYPQIEWAMLLLLPSRRASPHWPTLISHLTKGSRLSWPTYWLMHIVTLPRKGVKYCNQHVWMSFHSYGLKHDVQTSLNFLYVLAVVWDWSLLWWQCNTLCTSGFVDEAMFSQNGPYSAGVAGGWRNCLLLGWIPHQRVCGMTSWLDVLPVTCLMTPWAKLLSATALFV